MAPAFYSNAWEIFIVVANMPTENVADSADSEINTRSTVLPGQRRCGWFRSGTLFPSALPRFGESCYVLNNRASASSA
jgi:hypothetical protein